MNKTTKTLAIISVLSGGVLLISNLAAVKIWNLFGIPFDGGLLLFPLIYILGDLAVELFGKKTAGTIIWSSFFLNLMAAGVFLLVGILPAHDGWSNQAAYEAILGFVPRIVIGSLAAYVSSSLINNIIFQRMKDSTVPEEQNKRFFSRAIGSSAIARLIDTVVFETIAFFGVLPIKDFLIQLAFAYLAGMILEIVLFPITNLLAYKLRAKKKPQQVQ